MTSFALIGVAGYISSKHVEAIKNTNSKLLATCDVHDNVGFLDRYFPEAEFFVSEKDFFQFVKDNHIDYVTICTPNHLHLPHILASLRAGANVICEKPLALTAQDLSLIRKEQQAAGKKVFVVLQLRLHARIVALRERIAKSSNIHDVELTYITPRGKWYDASWKSDIQKSGGVATNIGIHFFDMLTWIFGAVEDFEVHVSAPNKMAGFLQLERARVKWFLSIDKNDLPEPNRSEHQAFRSITIDGQEMEFSQGFTNLHTATYEDVLSGQGFSADDAHPSIVLVEALRTAPIVPASTEKKHPQL